MKKTKIFLFSVTFHRILSLSIIDRVLYTFHMNIFLYKLRKEAMILNDEEIVELFLKRDETALKYTKEKFGSRLKSLANNILQDPDTAEECENDTYFEAWNRIPPHEPRDYLFAFPARLIRHISLDVCRLRSRKKRNAFLTELTEEIEQCIPDPKNTETEIDGILLGEAISQFLRTLSKERRNVFLRRYFYFDSITSICNRFSLSESKVKTMLFRCRKELREYLMKEGYKL